MIAKTTMITIQSGIIFKISHRLPKNFQPFKSTIVEITAILAKTTISTTETTRITMQVDFILESFQELPNKISAI